MNRFTISIDDHLAEEFDGFIESFGYQNRSEAFRDIVRERLERRRLETADAADAPWCVATVSFVYDHHEKLLYERVTQLQHDHHDLTVSSMHVHLNHDDCLEVVVLRGPTSRVRYCAERVIAERGARHGSIHVVPLQLEGRRHRHAGDDETPHVHAHPLT